MANNLRRHLSRFAHSNAALALPVTFLILFVSTLGIIAFTYAYSVERVNAQGQILKVSNAKENFQSLDQKIVETIGQPGSSQTIEIADSGGQINIQPANNSLRININDNSGIDKTIFDTAVGQVTYELPYASSSDTGLFLKGDREAITNQSGSTLSQLQIVNGAQHVEIQLRYRPMVSYSFGGLQDGKPVNNIRIYIVNLNSSDPVALMGQLPLKISCRSTELAIKTYNVTYGAENLVITATLDDNLGVVTVPLSSGPSGAIINIEMVISDISIVRWLH